MKRKISLVVLISIVFISLLFNSCSSVIILMTGHNPVKIKRGCITPEPGTYLDPLSNLLLVMTDRYRDVPDSLLNKSRKYVEMMAPRVRLKTDTVITAQDNYNIPVIIYNNLPVRKRKSQPVIIFFHGGGFVRGDIEIYDNLCSEIAKKTGALLISVGYRLAPEFPFPYAVNDAWDILGWASVNAGDYGGDTEDITLMGDSAGGNISAVISIMARDSAGPDISNQVLIYPLTVFIDTLTESRRYFLLENERDFVLSDDFLERATSAYLQHDEDGMNPYISPQFARLDSTLPRTLIVTAQCDPLRDEARDYGLLLGKAGVEVEYNEYKGMLHGFISLYQVMKEGRTAIKDIAGFITGGTSKSE